MWSALLRQFSKNFAEFIQHPQQKFYDYRFKIGDDITSHITTLETLVFELKDVGVDISEVQLMEKILCTLPAHFDSVTPTWENLDRDRQTLT